MTHYHGTSLPHGLVLVREAARIDNYFYMLTLTGSQAPIVVSVEYAARDPSKRLSRNAVIRAIAKVVEKQPALGQVCVRQPSISGKDHLWLARLPSLSVDDCVSFIDLDERDPAEASRQTLEMIMSQWFDLTDTSKPYWRVTVANMRTVYFAFNHIVCDGRSGLFFHRELLAALNDIEGDKMFSLPKRFTVCTDIFPDHFELAIAKHTSFHMAWFIIKFLLIFIVDLLFWPRYITFKDTKRHPYQPSVKIMAPPEERIDNKIVSLRISSKTMQRVLTECRNHSTSFTAFFDTILNVTLCADIYPEALLLRTSTVVDLRGFCKWPYEETMCNMGASWTKVRSARPFATIGKPSDGKKSITGVHTDYEAFWAMANYRKRCMNKHLGYYAIQEYLGLGMSPAHIDDFTEQLFGKSLSITRNYGSSISNLGLLKPKEEEEGQEWRFTSTDWASSTVRSMIGPGLNICVISAPGADCVINFIYHKGSYDPEHISGIANIIKTRMGQVLGGDDEGIIVRA